MIKIVRYLRRNLAAPDLGHVSLLLLPYSHEKPDFKFLTFYHNEKCHDLGHDNQLG